MKKKSPIRLKGVSLNKTADKKGRTRFYFPVLFESSRMGRKIPGKKHHGVKDPEKQAQKRLEKVKAKVRAQVEGGRRKP